MHAAGKRRILLVEDEFLIRLTLAEALVEEGYEVIEAASAEDALTLAADDRAIGLMLTDIQLSGARDGYWLAARMRALMPNLPVVFMSGRPSQLPDGAGAPQLLIAKPYLPSEICTAIRRLLAQAN